MTKSRVETFEQLAKQQNMTLAEWHKWDRERHMALRGKELLEQRKRDQECIDLYCDWRYNSPEKLKINYKKED